MARKRALTVHGNHLEIQVMMIGTAAVMEKYIAEVDLCLISLFIRPSPRCMGGQSTSTATVRSQSTSSSTFRTGQESRVNLTYPSGLKQQLLYLEK